MFNVKLFAKFARKRFKHYAEPRAAHLSVLNHLFGHMLREIRADRKTDADTPADGEKIKSFTPITSPARFNSGPPELPD